MILSMVGKEFLPSQEECGDDGGKDDFFRERPTTISVGEKTYL